MEHDIGFIVAGRMLLVDYKREAIIVALVALILKNKKL